MRAMGSPASASARRGRSCSTISAVSLAGPHTTSRWGDGSMMPWCCSANSTSGYGTTPSAGTTVAISAAAANRRPSPCGTGICPAPAIAAISAMIASPSGELGATLRGGSL